MDGEDVQIVTIKDAMSGNVSYTQPVVIHQSSKMKITVVPFYIDRSTGKELSVKILTKKKDTHLWIGFCLKKNRRV
ncbi:hypothetical protein SAMN05421734_101436 [Pelagirhabdus alkalitolerans]|uniref:Uncharacterized protein n=1 Tax=Pelagirhabdus alkalitolerans TaxID=1612202 RepID=A0A1G6GRD3_9BACI|nr:hypothetical protein [Pelagirhabdus alkalitolerans]SDB84602.1 hypothetical protein SAMN05421734_101436 [Pelagirhabdus alkalitolerans]